MEFYSKTDVGKARKTNQDAVNVKEISDDFVWSVVCDGMGGTSGGDVASRTAVEEVTKYLDRNLNENKNFEKIKEIMYSAVQEANEAIYEKARKDDELSSMGTTVVLCAIVGDMLHVMHAGDSRAYLIDKSGIKQLSKDHSIVQEMIENGEITQKEAKNHPRRNIITRALGIEADIKLDYTQIKLQKDDIILLCTDGLTNHLDENQIFKICSNSDFSSVAKKLVDEANKHGGSDNITVAVIKY